MNPLNNITYGLYILTSKDKKDNGCMINTLMQQSSSPERISITINKENFTTKMIEKSGIFNVSVLGTSAPFDLIKRFGFSSGKQANKFEGFDDYKRSENGLAYITKSTNAYFSAKVTQKIDLDSHYMFIAQITKMEILSSEESLSYAYYHKYIKPAPQKTSKKSYVCKICGYVHEGETLPDDFICPICKHGKEVFEPLELQQTKQSPKKEKATSTKTRYICPVCGYYEDSETDPSPCIICGAKMEKQN